MGAGSLIRHGASRKGLNNAVVGLCNLRCWLRTGILWTLRGNIGRRKALFLRGNVEKRNSLELEARARSTL